MAIKLKIKAPKAKPKLNKTNIKSPIGQLGGGIGAPAGKKFKSSTLSNQFANQPVLQAPKIDKSPVNTNPIAGVSQTLAETNSILVEIQNQLALDFADRIATEQDEINRLKAQKNRARQSDKASSFGSLTALGATFGPKGAAIGAIADVLKGIFGPFIEIFSKIASFFTIVAAGFIANQGIDWITNNWDKVSGFFDWMGEHGHVIVKTLMFGIGGIIAYRITRAVIKLVKFAIRAVKAIHRGFRLARVFIKRTLPNLFKNASKGISGGLKMIKGAGSGLFKGVMNIGKSVGKFGKNIIKGGGKKVVAKTVTKSVGKGAGKAFLKKIPVIGLGLGAIFAIERISKGDWWGALMELGSGAASMVPGVGTAVSVGLDAGLVAKDIHDAKKSDVEGGDVDDAAKITPKDKSKTNLSSSVKSPDLKPVNRNTGGIVNFPTAEVGGDDSNTVAGAASGGDSIDSLDPDDFTNFYIDVSRDTYGVVV